MTVEHAGISQLMQEKLQQALSHCDCWEREGEDNQQRWHRDGPLRNVPHQVLIAYLLTSHYIQSRVVGATGSADMPRLPWPSRLLKPIWRDPKAYPGQLSDTVPPVCPWSFPELPPSGTCLERLSRRQPKEIPKPPRFHMEDQRLYSKLLTGIWACNPYLSLRVHPATLRRLLVSAFLLCNLVLLVNT